MCGIVGAFGPPGSMPGWLANACDALRRRGPDACGVWSDREVGVALGHRRLAVLDLSPAGSQPMASTCGRYHVVFNGEIYNHLELRAALRSRSWRGHSDTETLLACFVEWGFERTLKAAIGMFAVAAFDAVNRRLCLARDRLGEKPLYYGYAGDTFVFASQLQALRVAPSFDATIDRGALALYMQRSYVPAPYTIHVSTRKLPAGSWLEVTPGQVRDRALPTPLPYWSALETALAGDREPLDISDSEAVSKLGLVIGDAVRGQMLSDVPLGAFLSGGIDSSTVVALMQAQSSRPVRTFSIGFREAAYDESRQARLVAEHLGTDHTELTVHADDALALIPRLPEFYDEPFGDSSQLPTCLVAQLARRHVTVALSGDGGDELFSGYNRHFLAARVWPRLSSVPRPFRDALARAIRIFPPATWDRFAAAIRRVTPFRYHVRIAGEKLHKSADVLACADGEELYRRLLSQWWQAPVVLRASSTNGAVGDQWPPMSSLTHQMMLRDALSYLPDDILVKVDRAAMAVSLETRVPMLDHRVFEFAWRLPLRMKVRDGLGKWVLRQLLYRYVPRHLVERPKMGFAVPLDAWLRGRLRDWAEHLLGENRLRSQGYLDADVIRRRWHEHLSGRHNWQYSLWNVLMFEAWVDATR
jgi:asparagine synthase (glutamine-hydrolysing)